MTRNVERSKLAAGGTYAAIWLGAAALFFVIRSFGEGLSAPGGAPAAPPVGVIESGPNALCSMVCLDDRDQDCDAAMRMQARSGRRLHLRRLEEKNAESN